MVFVVKDAKKERKVMEKNVFKLITMMNNGKANFNNAEKTILNISKKALENFSNS